MKVLLRRFTELTILAVIVLPILAAALLRTDGSNINDDRSWRGEGSYCATGGCHSPNDLAPNQPVFAISTSASTFTPGGAAIQVTVTFGTTGRADHGFMITAADPDDSNSIVSGLTVTDATNTQLHLTNTAITHTQKLNASTGYSLNWSPPVGAPRRVTFWAAGVGANSGSGDSDIYRDSLTIFNDTFLPVELADFSGVVEGSDVILSWWTASETENLGFDVQWRNSDSERFETVGFVAGAGTVTERQDYSLRITDIEPGRHLFRLRQVDFDGTATMSEQIELSVEIPERFELSSAYPNPFNPSTTFRLAVDRSQDVVITAADPLGRIVAEIYNGWVTEHEPIEIRFDASGLSTGLYLVRAQGENFSASRTVMLVR